jgi:cyclophilin family peptidyl-prolyl cis-trans isomerase
VAKQWANAPDLTIDLAKSYAAELDTNHGEITINLHAERSPIAVNNYVFLAREGFYDGAIFHRVIPGFVAQGGDPTGTGRGGPGYRFRDELEGPGSYARGIVAMANAGPNTNGSQFFICIDDCTRKLSKDYNLFGYVVSGLDVAQATAVGDVMQSVVVEERER